MIWTWFCNWFTKITGLLPQWFCFRTKVTDEDPLRSGRKIRGPILIVSNHTSLYDYAVYLFVFFFRTLRAVMAELLFRKPVLGAYLKWMGGIKVDRDAHEFRFIDEAEEILKKGGTVLIFPESRLPRAEEERPLPFKPSVAVLALRANVPVVPVYTNGSYFSKKRAKVVVGAPVNVSEWVDPALSERENLERVTAMLRDKITELGKLQ
ncbi:MAG: 1-acyl-sn-glycerol-3-phosphate acyltransferase [Lachnospiraceae bacterium]|nr:1-acyl-sn-glycerol-3-phosphate acyltransferase [Lachnospiraceae bacterium]